VEESLENWDEFMGVEVSPDWIKWSGEEKYEFLSAIRCWHFLSANGDGFTPERMEVLTTLLHKFSGLPHADRHVIAIMQFYFAFPTEMRREDWIYSTAVVRLKVYDEGFSTQLAEYLSHLSPSQWADRMWSLTHNRSESLPDLVSLWTPYAKQMTCDCVGMITSLCFQRLAGGHFEDEALQKANMLFAEIPKLYVETRKLGLKCRLDWITRGSPLKSNVEFLVKWCCDNCPDFADAFVKQFGLIFTGPIEDPEVRNVLLPIFLKTVFIRGNIQRIETLVANVRNGPPDPEIIAALFGALSKLESKNLKELGHLTFSLWRDLTTGEAELNYVRTAMKFCDGGLIFTWLRELEAIVRENIHADPQCQEDVTKHFERLFECGTSMSHTLTPALTLTDRELRRFFDEKRLNAMMQIIGRLLSDSLQTVDASMSSLSAGFFSPSSS
jgi:hypothetical protein